MRHQMWTEEFEPSRRQRGGRGRHGHGGHGSHGGPGGPGAGGWGPWGVPFGPPPPWVAQMFGPGLGGPGGPGRTGRRPRVRRGDVRSAILDVLGGSPEPMNGYQVIQAVAERTDGVWKPSPGSIYPTIAQLQDEGLVEDAPTGRKAVRLTEEGQAHVAAHAEELAAVWAPFEEQVEDSEAVSFKQVIGQTVGAIAQVASTGTPEQRAEALQILADTRRRLYSLLAEGPESLVDEQDDVEDEEEPPAPPSPPGAPAPRPGTDHVHEGPEEI